METYDPWHELSRHEGVRLVLAELPGTRRGQIDFDTHTITLHTRLLPAEQRCTLAHELVHLERGPVLVRNTPREERIVAAIAARRLVPLSELAERLRWTDDLGLIADELGVDARTVRVRLTSLSERERADLAEQLNPSTGLMP